MDWKEPFDRRKFIKIVGAIAGGAVAGWAQDRLGLSSSSAEANVPDPGTCLCSDQVRAQAIGGPRVVHMHTPSATSWNFSSGWYGDYVDQAVIHEMVEEGLLLLTGQSTMVGTWDTLFRGVTPAGYQVGEKIALKINLNNANGCADDENRIDALHQPLIALFRTLKIAGVQEQDIWVYDATVNGRYIPDRIRNPILSQYPDIEFYGRGSCGGVNQVVYSQTDPSLRIQFSDPGGDLSDRWLPDLLGQATYLINVPILKKHNIHRVSLGFKNHFGSLNNIMREVPDNLHEFIRPTGALYSASYSPFVDIYSKSVIRDKTVLIMGDGLYGSRTGARDAPVRWSTFGNDAPSSLFLSVDPVAIDCVMTDLIGEEIVYADMMTGAYDYLFCGQDVGLGICEGNRSSPGGSPWQEPYGSGYQSIEYIRLTHPFTTFVDVPSTHWAHDYIEAIYQAGIVVGCSLDPPLYCPEGILDRAESSVFILRGNYGAIPDPPYTPPASPTFGDVDPSFWGYGWIESLWRDGFTAGCSADPLLYCPSREHTRAEACVFFLRIKNGVTYQPPAPDGLFADVDIAAWYAGWVEAAYNEGLLPECGTNPPTFCPEAPLDRAWAAYMMCQAKNLPVP